MYVCIRKILQQQIPSLSYSFQFDTQWELVVVVKVGRDPVLGAPYGAPLSPVVP